MPGLVSRLCWKSLEKLGLVDGECTRSKFLGVKMDICACSEDGCNTGNTLLSWYRNAALSAVSVFVSITVINTLLS